LDALRNSFGGQLVEELPHEFRCVSVDLLARQPVVHRRGPVAEVVGCSLLGPSSEVLAHADLAIRADTSGIGFLEWHQIDRAREVGRIAAPEALPQIIELVQR
jgi:predicted acylesterase/phospholipase RssA